MRLSCKAGRGAMRCTRSCRTKCRRSQCKEWRLKDLKPQWICMRKHFYFHACSIIITSLQNCFPIDYPDSHSEFKLDWRHQEVLCPHLWGSWKQWQSLQPAAGSLWTVLHCQRLIHIAGCLLWRLLSHQLAAWFKKFSCTRSQQWWIPEKDV